MSRGVSYFALLFKIPMMEITKLLKIIVVGSHAFPMVREFLPSAENPRLQGLH